MDRENLDFFRQLLQKQREQIVASTAETLKNEMGLSPDDMPDENDLASVLYNQGLTLRLRDRETQLLRKINRALRLIEEDEYGYCEVCDDEIDIARLKARPVTTMCIECKEEAERNERQRSSAPAKPMRRKQRGAPTTQDTGVHKPIDLAKDNDWLPDMDQEMDMDSIGIDDDPMEEVMP